MYAIVEIVIWLTILLLAVYNIIFYISKIENNKFMTKLFYFLVCLESILIISEMIFQIIHPERLAHEICEEKDKNTKSYLMIYQIFVRLCQTLIIMVIIFTMMQLRLALMILADQDRNMEEKMRIQRKKFKFNKTVIISAITVCALGEIIL